MFGLDFLVLVSSFRPVLCVYVCMCVYVNVCVSDSYMSVALVLCVCVSECVSECVCIVYVRGWLFGTSV